MQEEEKLIWKTVGRKKVAEYPILDVYSVERVSFDGYQGSYIELRPPLWVNVIAVVEQEGVPHYLMVKQFRHGSERITAEFPAGVVDPGEEPLVAAKRELLEETGYQAEKLIEIGNISPNPAIMSNRVYTYLAVNPKKIADQHLDIDERVEAVKIPCAEVDVAMGSGLYDNGIIMIAWSFYQRYLQDGRADSRNREAKG